MYDFFNFSSHFLLGPWELEGYVVQSEYWLIHVTLEDKLIYYL